MAEIARQQALAGEVEQALLTWILFETYMRPSEGLSLRYFQAVKPMAAEGMLSYWAFVIHAEELETPD